ncbi:hypothetical protein AWM70_07430 [Paenibacillus yonginensis]|uniref:Ferrous iron transporter B n=1 Tax=Paenibacillus yonginensis TaxID=1462996 RepID=A0A1B1MZ26_9BACL|nr:nucleoside recognition domain-containing protein [Paenibacillus yonginensis]ANS74432.1 hypothetical protein AWM70_07430 [Paenibacillus yonginensis]
MLNAAAQLAPGKQHVVLIGFESSGKSSLFRGLTGEATGEEANFKGSTVMSRQARFTEDMDLIDLPGMRLKDDSLTTRIAMQHLSESDRVLLVVRGTHASEELPRLLEAAQVESKPGVLVLTFEDKTTTQLYQLAEQLKDWLGIPVITVDTRHLSEGKIRQIQAGLRLSRPIRQGAAAPDMVMEAVKPQETWFEHAVWGRWLSLCTLLLMFALPVVLAYLISGWLQPLLDSAIIDPVKQGLQAAPAFIQSLLIGDYGLISLGLYSFVWAFPVVLLLGFSLAVVEESGLKDRITDSLDGWLRKIGLTGRDLIPVISGFGCNVVAVFQSRTCSSCTRQACVSLIAFGSACSYQIGASLSIFSSAGRLWLFVPYLAVLFIAGAVHTRIWNRHGHNLPLPAYEAKTFLQVPSGKAVSWRLRSVIKQFLTQAMPIFLLICLVAASLNYWGVLNKLSEWAAPALQIFRLPEEASNGILFSVLRKDGLLTLNQDGGALVASLQTSQLFVLVFLASTLTACLVTLWTIRKEMGIRTAASIAGKQLLTSVCVSMLIAWLTAWH